MVSGLGTQSLLYGSGPLLPPSLHPLLDEVRDLESLDALFKRPAPDARSLGIWRTDPKGPPPGLAVVGLEDFRWLYFSSCPSPSPQLCSRGRPGQKWKTLGLETQPADFANKRPDSCVCQEVKKPGLEPRPFWLLSPRLCSSHQTSHCSSRGLRSQTPGPVTDPRGAAGCL